MRRRGMRVGRRQFLGAASAGLAAGSVWSGFGQHIADQFHKQTDAVWLQQMVATAEATLSIENNAALGMDTHFSG